MPPGATTLARTPRFRYSSAITLVRWMTPAFDEQYAAEYGCDRMPAFDAMLTIVPAAVEQVRQRGLADEERAGEVDADDALPVGERHLVRVGEPADAGAVDDHLRAAEIRRRRRPWRLAPSRDRRRRPGRPGPSPPCLPDLGGRLLGRVDRDVEARDRRAFGAQLAGRCMPESRTRARHHCYSSVEASHGAEPNARASPASNARIRRPSCREADGSGSWPTAGEHRPDGAAREGEQGTETARRCVTGGPSRACRPWGVGAGKRFPLASSAPRRADELSQWSRQRRHWSERSALHDGERDPADDVLVDLDLPFVAAGASGRPAMLTANGRVELAAGREARPGGRLRTGPGTRPGWRRGRPRAWAGRDRGRLR